MRDLVKKRISEKKYRELNYKSTAPIKQKKVMKKCTLCPATYQSVSKFDRFCVQCRYKVSNYYV